MPQSNFKLIKQDQNQLIQTKEETEKENSTSINQTVKNEPEGKPNANEIFPSGEQNDKSPSVNIQNLVQNVSVYGRPKIIQPIYIFHSNQQIGYVEVDVMDENAMEHISELLQRHAT